MHASIAVERSNIIIDGNLHTLEGDYLPILGLNLTSVSNVTINNANIKRFDTGIYLESASQCIISGNNLTENNSAGILLISSSLNNVSQNMITHNSFGIRLEEQSHFNTISQNKIADNGNGIDLYSIDFPQENNIVLGNDIKNNGWGIHFLVTSNCTITRNNIENNTEGVVIYRSRYTTITENNITSNTNHGIYLDMSYGGKVYHNNFIGNGPPHLYFSTNVWDNGYPSGGNYWSDYTGVDSNHDGIGDSWYEITQNNTDYYPLMGMFSDFNATSDHHIQTICNSTISDFQFNGTAISFDVSGENDTASFSRMCISRALMDEPYRVFVNGTEVGYTLLTDSSNMTHNYIYFTYNHSTQEVVIVPEFSSFIILPLFMIATLLAVIVYRRKHSM